MNKNEIMNWIESHIFMQNKRTFFRNDNTVTHYRIDYINGDVYEWKSVRTDKYNWKEHTITWINGKLVEEADYIYYNFGWKRIA